MPRKAKIIATLGPASSDEAMIRKLIEAGMNVARMNFSHGTHEQHAARISLLQSISKRLDTPVGILQDLQGPKIRVGKLPAPLQLAAGERVFLYAAGDTPPQTNCPAIPVDFRELFESVRTDERLLLDDGRLTLQVLSAKDCVLEARVLVGGMLSAHKGINLPGVRLRIDGFTEKDRKDLAFGISHGVDAVAISFVRSADDVKIVRAAMEKFSGGRHFPLLIAKLEKPEAMKELEAILEVVDGVMVARGDLGVELPPEQVPPLQKHIIRLANARAKLVITATQMLESMTQNPLPTRAEASDVANAIFDGTDAVMLSEETASGEYPMEAVAMMDRIIREAESHFIEWGSRQDRRSDLGQSTAASMARAAHTLADDASVTAVAVFTMQGQSAWTISKVRPRVPILAFTPEESTYRRLTFLWGAQPHLISYVNSLEEMTRQVDAALMQTGNLKEGDRVVLVCGFPVGALRAPNIALLHTIGQP